MQTTLTSNNIIEFYRATGKYDFCSNLYRRAFKFDGREFPTREHAYQFGKMRNSELKEWVMTCPFPHIVAVIGHGLFAWDIVENWTKLKVPRMRKIQLAFFSQHTDLREKLLSTGNKILIEKSSFDNFWGAGPKGKGKNMLGKILMETRDYFLKQGDKKNEK